MSKKKRKHKNVTNNLVKKHMEEFNRPNVEQDKKKEEKKNPSYTWDEQ